MRRWNAGGRRSLKASALIGLALSAAMGAVGATWLEAQTPVRRAVRTMPRVDACFMTDSSCVPPPVPREFRGVWVATVGNMDWPSRPGLSTDSARAELVQLLDAAVATGLNAVFFQVRPAGDAFYVSRIEPWSEYLTGLQGRAPDKPWDPLAFAIREAHARGLELHAWFNPYRAKDPSAKGQLSPSHFSRQYPGYAKRYGPYTWFDPGEPLVRRHTVRVILDVVRRYDVDGVHLDDYFYPYPVKQRGRDVPFPDATSYQKYIRAGGKLDRDDWRRDNVNRLVDTLRIEIAKAKPWVRFGISPFGIWRPGEPASVTGFDAYAKLYADARLWLARGWVDYLVPQLYWGVEQEGQRFPDLLRWWQAQNDSSRHVWPGLADYKIVSGNPGWRAHEIVRQVDTARSTAGVSGVVHFQMKTLRNNSGGVATALAQGPYAAPALPPPVPWKGAAAPGTPAIAVAEARDGPAVTIAGQGSDEIRWWIIQARTGSDWRTYVIDGSRADVPLEMFDGIGGTWPEVLTVKPVGMNGIEGPPVAIRLR
ncbi:MAG: family 10 glycosylhydrolase [Gemmatimonadaceae bacterium]|nr:family 10 glycosylhydrolase [Gemmatimonadaceae bacterium]